VGGGGQGAGGALVVMSQVASNLSRVKQHMQSLNSSTWPTRGNYDLCMKKELSYFLLETQWSCLLLSASRTMSCCAHSHARVPPLRPEQHAGLA
jgi:hypothetical protein